MWVLNCMFSFIVLLCGSSMLKVHEMLMDFTCTWYKMRLRFSCASLLLPDHYVSTLTKKIILFLHFPHPFSSLDSPLQNLNIFLCLQPFNKQRLYLVYYFFTSYLFIVISGCLLLFSQSLALCSGQFHVTKSTGSFSLCLC